MRFRNLWRVWLVLCACNLFCTTVALAQEESADMLGGGLVGVIPGTDMLRDEFRARAEAQLVALALDALVHHTVYGAYPASFGELLGSDAYNLKPVNLFTGRPVGSIYFVPTDRDMTNDPYLNILFEFEIPQTQPIIDFSGSGDPAAPNPLDQLALQPVRLRVRPQAITNPSAGDVYYYTDGEMLQLIMFAPDGTFVEHVEEAPHFGWRSRMNVGEASSDWPFDLHCAQVLLFLEVLLPRYYNYVQYMGDAGQYPRAQLAQMGGAERLNLAAELQINVLNPLTRELISTADEPQPGNLLSGSPLAIVTRNGQLLTQDMLDEAPPADFGDTPTSADKSPKQDSKPGKRPPLGGH